MVWFKDVLIEADKLGLEVQGRAASGIFEEWPVEIAPVWGDDNALYAVRAPLVPAMDLGVEMHRRTFTVASGLETGNRDLDAEYVIGGDEHRRAVQLFAGPLGEAIVRHDRAGHRLWLDDSGPAVFGEPIEDDVRGDLVRALRVAADLGRTAEAARRDLPAASALASTSAALLEAATARGLATLSAPLFMRAAIDGVDVVVGSVRTASRRYALLARGHFAVELGLELHVRRRGILDEVGALVGRRELESGDAAFDRRFVVRARAGEHRRLTALLDADVRAILVELDQRFGPLTLHDAGLTVEPVPFPADAARLGELFDLTADATGRVSGLASHPPAAGAYR